jgi:FtsH-binding integral membrane protein
MFKKRPGEPAGSKSGCGDGKESLWIPLAGTALAVGAVYLCHYTFVRDLPSFSLSALATGMGLLGTFCVLTAAAIGGIRQLVFNPGNRFWPALSLVISVISLAVLIGLVILGVRR